MSRPWFPWLGGAGLIAGTAIGATVLVLVQVSLGFSLLQVLFLYVFAWFLMMVTGQMLAEVCIALSDRHSFLSITAYFYGPLGRCLSTVLFCGLLFFLLSAYLSYLNYSTAVLLMRLQWPFYEIVLQLGLASLLVLFLYGGRVFVDIINRLCLFMMVVSFAGILLMGAPYVQLDHLLQMQSFRPLDIFDGSLLFIANAFGYHVVLPSVRLLQGKNAKDWLFRAVFWGTLFPLCLYLVWFALSVSLVPGPLLHQLLRQSGQIDDLLTDAMLLITGQPSLLIFFWMLKYSFIVTSAVGISMSLYDLLFDALPGSLSKKVPQALLAFLTVFPSVIYTMVYPKGFLVALSFSGVLVILLNMVLPAMMCLQLRAQESGHQRAPFVPDALVWVVLLFSTVLLLTAVSAYL